jgi:hypothetical protein
MSSTFDLDVVPFGDHGGPPVVYTKIKMRSENSLGHTYVGQECHDVKEFEHQIDCMQQELEEIHQRGIRVFAKSTRQN